MSPLPLAPVGLGPTSDYDAMRTPTPDNPDTVDWAAVAQQLLEQPADYGMKRAARAVTGRNLAGPTWQAWRDEFVAVVKTLDPDLQDNLVQRFEAVLG